VRWNQKYTKDDLILVEQLKAQHLIKKNAETRKVHLHPPNPKSRYYIEKLSHFDFMAYHFLYSILPQPEIFEIKQILKIPRQKIERRHDLMLSIIQDRIKNQEKYEKEYYSKYSKFRYYPRDRMDHNYDIYTYYSDYISLIQGKGPTKFMEKIQIKKIEGCKHEESQVLTLLSKYNQSVSEDFHYQWKENLHYGKW
jgi:hypothetical protein